MANLFQAWDEDIQALGAAKASDDQIEARRQQLAEHFKAKAKAAGLSSKKIYETLDQFDAYSRQNSTAQDDQLTPEEQEMAQRVKDGTVGSGALKEVGKRFKDVGLGAVSSLTRMGGDVAQTVADAFDNDKSELSSQIAQGLYNATDDIRSNYSEGAKRAKKDFWSPAGLTMGLAENAGQIAGTAALLGTGGAAAGALGVTSKAGKLATMAGMAAPLAYSQGYGQGKESAADEISKTSNAQLWANVQAEAKAYDDAGGTGEVPYLVQQFKEAGGDINLMKDLMAENAGNRSGIMTVATEPLAMGVGSVLSRGAAAGGTGVMAKFANAMNNQGMSNELARRIAAGGSAAIASQVGKITATQMAREGVQETAQEGLEGYYAKGEGSRAAGRKGELNSADWSGENGIVQQGLQGGAIGALMGAGSAGSSLRNASKLAIEKNGLPEKHDAAIIAKEQADAVLVQAANIADANPNNIDAQNAYAEAQDAALVATNDLDQLSAKFNALYTPEEQAVIKAATMEGVAARKKVADDAAKAQKELDDANAKEQADIAAQQAEAIKTQRDAVVNNLAGMVGDDVALSNAVADLGLSEEEANSLLDDAHKVAKKQKKEAAKQPAPATATPKTPFEMAVDEAFDANGNRNKAASQDIADKHGIKNIKTLIDAISERIAQNEKTNQQKSDEIAFAERQAEIARQSAKKASQAQKAQKDAEKSDVLSDKQQLENTLADFARNNDHDSMVNFLRDYDPKEADTLIANAYKSVDKETKAAQDAIAATKQAEAAKAKKAEDDKQAEQKKIAFNNDMADLYAANPDRNPTKAELDSVGKKHGVKSPIELAQAWVKAKNEAKAAKEAAPKLAFPSPETATKDERDITVPTGMNINRDNIKNSDKEPIIVRSNGKPFLTQEAAEQALKNKSTKKPRKNEAPITPETHEVIPVDGGFAIAPVVEIQQPKKPDDNEDGGVIADAPKPNAPVSPAGEQVVDTPPTKPVEDDGIKTKNIKQPKPADKTVYPHRDDLLTAIAKMKGLNKAQAIYHGIKDRLDLNKRGRSLLGVFKDDGEGFDVVARKLSDMGYPVNEGGNTPYDNINGTPTTDALLDALRKALFGEDVGTEEYILNKYAAQREADQKEAEEMERLFNGKGSSSWDEADALDNVSNAIVDDIVSGTSGIAPEKLSETLKEVSNEPIIEIGGQAPNAKTEARSPQNSDAETTGTGKTGQQESQSSTGQDSGIGLNPSFNLNAQTNEELAKRDADNKASEAKRQAEEKAAKDKAQADKEVSDFRLSGSNAPADVAMAGGQNDMFAPPTRGEREAEKAETKQEQPQDKVIANNETNWIGADKAFSKNIDNDYGPSGAISEAVDFAKSSPKGTTTLETIIRPNGNKWHTLYLSNGKGGLAIKSIGGKQTESLESVVAYLEDEIKKESESAEVFAQNKRKEEISNNKIAEKEGFVVGLKLGTIIPNTNRKIRQAYIAKNNNDGTFDVEGLFGNKPVIIKGMSALGIKDAIQRHQNTQTKQPETKTEPKAKIDFSEASVKLEDALNKWEAIKKGDIVVTKSGRALIAQSDAKGKMSIRFKVREGSLEEALSVLNVTGNNKVSKMLSDRLQEQSNGRFEIYPAKEQAQDKSVQNNEPAPVKQPETTIMGFLNDGELENAYFFAENQEKPIRFTLSNKKEPIAYFLTEPVDLGNNITGFVGISTAPMSKSQRWLVIEEKSRTSIGFEEISKQAAIKSAKARLSALKKEDLDRLSSNIKPINKTDQEMLVEWLAKNNIKTDDEKTEQQNINKKSAAIENLYDLALGAAKATQIKADRDKNKPVDFAANTFEDKWQKAINGDAKAIKDIRDYFVNNKRVPNMTKAHLIIFEGLTNQDFTSKTYEYVASKFDEYINGFSDVNNNKFEIYPAKEADNAIADKAQPQQPALKKGEVDYKFSSGEVVLTATGRETTPFPKFDLSTNRKATNSLKVIESWLMDNAIAEAKARGDKFNLLQFNASRNKPQQADKDSAEMYLFDSRSVQPIPAPFMRQLVAGTTEPTPVTQPESKPTPVASTSSSDLTDEEYIALQKAYNDFKAKTDKINATYSRDVALEIATGLVAEMPDKEDKIRQALIDAIRENQWNRFEINFPKQPIKVETDVELNRALKRLQKALEGTDYTVNGTFNGKSAKLLFSYKSGANGSRESVLIDRVNGKFTSYHVDFDNMGREVLKPLMDATVKWLNGEEIPKMKLGDDSQWDYTTLLSTPRHIDNAFNEAKAKAATAAPVSKSDKLAQSFDEAKAKQQPTNEDKPKFSRKATESDSVPIYRIDNKNFDANNIKPHGLYVSIPSDVSTFDSPHKDVGDTSFAGNASPKNPLNVESFKIQHNRGNDYPMEVSAGVSALKQLVSVQLFERLIKANKAELTATIKEQFPDIDTSQYYDAYELLEVLGAQLAIQEGYDAIIQKNGNDPFNEMVILDNSIIESMSPTDKPKNSRGTGEGLTTTQTRAILVKHFGEKLIKALESIGLLTIMATPPSWAKPDADGAYHNGKAYLFTDNLSAETVVATLAHELSGHKGFQELMTPTAYDSLMRQFNRLVKQGNAIALAAKARAEAAESTLGAQQDEYLPYLLTQQATLNATRSQQSAVTKVIEQVYRAVKAWLYRTLSAHGFDGVASKLLQPKDITLLAERMIREMGNYGTWVVSVHEQQSGYSAGKNIGYESVAIANGVSFGVVQNAALNIASGKPKATIAVMKGTWENTTPAKAKREADAALNDPSYIQVGMDPERHAFFYDRTTMQPVVSADRIIQIGSLVLAKNPVYAALDDFAFSRGTSEGLTTSQVRQTLVNRFGEKLIKILEDKGILRIVDSVKDIAEGALKSIKAYHGSPANFDRFMHEFVNSGEGAQAFGWGHYLAGRKALGEWYRTVLSNDFNRTSFIFRKDGERIQLNDLYTAPNFASRVSEKELVNLFKEYVLGDYDKRADTWQADADPKYDALAKINQDILKYNENTSGYAELNATRQILEQYKAKKFSAQRTSTSHKGTGQLYEVDIAAKEESFIDWFAKFDNLPTTEQEALLAIFKKFDTYRNLDTEGKTVGQLYQQVTRYSRDGLPKELSLALKELGYSGIKFLDQESRSRPYEKQYYNYVVFDENIITIKDRHYSQNNSDVEGYYHNRQVTLVADNLTAKTAIATFVHELGGHKGFQQMMSPKAYAIIMAVFDRLVAQGNPIAVAAKKRAQQAEDSQDRQTDEHIPYLLTEQEKAHQATKAQRNAVQRLIDHIVRAVKGWLFNQLTKYDITTGLGKRVSSLLDARDIQLMAEKMIREMGNETNPSNNTKAKGSQLSQLNTPQSQINAVRRKYEGTSQWMKAPNGKPTKLNEMQWLQVRTPNFKAWFGDWENDAKNASKVVDANGEPMVVYHGTRTKEKFTEFYTFTAGIFGAGAYFTVRKHEAGGYAKGGEIYEAFINVKSPLSLSDKAFMQNYFRPATQDEAISLGYDAVITTTGAEHKIDYVIAFEPTQIKSATSNTGEFNQTNPDIRFSRKAKNPITEGIKSAANDAKNSLPDPIAKSIDNFMAGRILPSSDMANITAKTELSIYKRTIGTQLNTALQLPDFKKVYDMAQRYLQHVAVDAYAALKVAPNLLGKLESWSDLKKDVKKIWPANFIKQKADRAAVASIIFDETLNNELLSDADILKALTRDQRQIYKEARDAIQVSLENTAKSEMVRKLLAAEAINWQTVESLINQDLPVGQFAQTIRDLVESRIGGFKNELEAILDADPKIKDALKTSHDKKLTPQTPAQKLTLKEARLTPEQMRTPAQKLAIEEAKATPNKKQQLTPAQKATLKKAKTLKAQIETTEEALKSLNDVENRLGTLIEQGYAPLMRFGEYTLTVRDLDGKVKSFFMFESKAEQVRATNAIVARYGKTVKLETDMISKEEFKQFAGMTPETVALFAKETGMDKDEAYQHYLKHAIPARSAMTRMIKRKGTEGFSDDIQRVVASFVMSNARMSAKNIYAAQIEKSIQDIESGKSVKDQAYVMKENVFNPKENFAQLRNFLFLWNLGGSIFFGLLNMTQPYMQTLPHLSQYVPIKEAFDAIIKGSGIAGSAMKNGTAPKGYEAEYNRAVREGVVDPQNVFMLSGVERGKTGATNSAWGVITHTMGLIAQVTESFNRKAVFIASLQVAKQKGNVWLKKKGFNSAYDFAKDTVDQTQGVYDKANRSNWANTSVGAPLMVFKQFSINYVEQMVRMWKKEAASGDEGKKAVFLMLALLASLSGVMGLPFIKDILDVSETTAAFLGNPVNIEREARLVLGKDLADPLFNGVLNHFVFNNLGMDIQGRTGMPDLVPWSNALNPTLSAQGRINEFASIAGATGGLIEKGYDATQLIARDEYGAAAKTLAPRFLTSWIDGSKMALTNEVMDSKGNKLFDTTWDEGLVKFIDANPKRMADLSRTKSLEWKDKSIQAYMTTNFKQKIIAAMMDNDQAEVQNLMKKVQEWNTSRPKYPVFINLNTLSKNANKKEQTFDARESIPKGMDWMKNERPEM